MNIEGIFLCPLLKRVVRAPRGRTTPAAPAKPKMPQVFFKLADS